jgi:hypothetical protein
MTRDIRESALLEGHARPTAVFVRGLRQRITIRTCPGLPATNRTADRFSPCQRPWRKPGEGEASAPW